MPCKNYLFLLYFLCMIYRWLSEEDTMKIIKLLCIVFCLISCSEDVNLEVTYDKALRDLKAPSSNPPQKLKGLLYILKGNKNESIFKLKKTKDVENGLNKKFIGRGGGSGIYYSNTKKKKKQEQKELDGDLYIVEIDNSNYKWNLSRESKIIKGYTCYKATASYSEYNAIKKESVDFSVVAWYTPDIPLPYGPSGYDGLPGLVLEVNRGGYYFMASEINFSKGVSLNIEAPENGISVTSTEFGQILNQKVLEKINRHTTSD